MIFTEGQKLQARRLHRYGHSYRDLAKLYGIHHEKIRRLIDPAWRERRRQLNNESRERLRESLKRGRVMPHIVDDGNQDKHSKPGHLFIPLEVLAERDRVMEYSTNLHGDPLPGRSALDRR